jgi:hypothetical protein
MPSLPFMPECTGQIAHNATPPAIGTRPSHIPAAAREIVPTIKVLPVLIATRSAIPPQHAPNAMIGLLEVEVSGKTNGFHLPFPIFKIGVLAERCTKHKRMVS